MREINTAGLLLLLLILPFLWGPFEKSAAQNETGYDLVAAVNALRASYGLEPYTIDYWIMDYANSIPNTKLIHKPALTLTQTGRIPSARD
jgi:hypothetical protein